MYGTYSTACKMPDLKTVQILCARTFFFAQQPEGGGSRHLLNAYIYALHALYFSKFFGGRDHSFSICSSKPKHARTSEEHHSVQFGFEHEHDYFYWVILPPTFSVHSICKFSYKVFHVPVLGKSMNFGRLALYWNFLVYWKNLLLFSTQMSKFGRNVYQNTQEFFCLI